MKIQQFLEHHGIAGNPFADEDAQTDLVFKGACIRNTFHPTWDKIYGDPSEPATAVVFGEKGSGKTAIRLQLARHLTDYNAEHPDRQLFVVAYDDFNAYLDRFRERFPAAGGGPSASWNSGAYGITWMQSSPWRSRNWWTGSWRRGKPDTPPRDDEPPPVNLLDASQLRDLMLLAACYDQSTAENLFQRWRRLRQKLRFPTWRSKWDLALGAVTTAAVIGFVIWHGEWSWFAHWLPYLLIAAGWAPRGWRLLRWWWKARQIARNTPVLNHSTKLLCRALLNFPGGQILGQPLPAWQRTDDRYELLTKLQGVLQSMHFNGIVVLVDRVDEPYLVNGATDLMRALVWPMLDNKFLKHSGLGVKLLLPMELERLLDREDRDFHQRARLDKQNLIRSLSWTGQSLYDMANARIAACAAEGRSPKITDLFDGVDQRRLMDSLAGLRVPRHLFKFMYRLFTAHCNAHTEDQPVWKISSPTFESVLALYQRDQEAFERGVGTG